LTFVRFGIARGLQLGQSDRVLDIAHHNPGILTSLFMAHRSLNRRAQDGKRDLVLLPLYLLCDLANTIFTKVIPADCKYGFEVPYVCSGLQDSS
jgi:hypothetical protein